MKKLKNIANLITNLTEATDLYELNHIDLDIITKYINLSPVYREKFRDYLDDVICAIDREDFTEKKYEAESQHIIETGTTVSAHKIVMRLAKWISNDYYYSLWGIMINMYDEDQGGEVAWANSST